uniref:Glycolipid-binding domain-containing protein n=1 Tax=Alloyangia mangrovi TaxID=1779329 RepID=A0A2A3JV73_9RHOB
MSETLATIRWRALDRDGEDKCRLARHEDGYMLVGHARFRDGTGWAALDYVVRCGPDWLTRSADVTGTAGGEEVRTRLTRQNGAWLLNGEEQPGLSDCTDVDFAFTPATNLMPLRRLPEVGRQVVEPRAVAGGETDLGSAPGGQVGQRAALRAQHGGKGVDLQTVALGCHILRHAVAVDQRQPRDRGHRRQW